MLARIPRTTRPNVRRFARGFSLLELMLVLAIIGILMAVAAVNVLGAGDRAKRRATEATLGTIKTQLDAYNLEHSAFPPDLATLVSAKFLEAGKLKDGWNRDLAYDPRPINTDQKYALGSSGVDGTLGNEDDISVWTMTEKK